MLKKIIALKNIGRFANSAAPGNPQLQKYTFVTGANGYGKTTLCSVLRSLQSGDPQHIIGRKTLGAAGDQMAELLLESGLIRFNGTEWNRAGPALAIFDGVFVADNVFSGETVELGQRRNLYRIIVGQDGVRMAQEDADLAAEARGKTTDISNSTKAIQPHFPNGMAIDDILAMKEIADVDQLIAEQTLHLEAVQQAGVVAARAGLNEFEVPELPAHLVEILAKTMEGIAQEAEQQIAAHFAAHDLTGKGGNWVATALPHTKDTCPFCGQGIDGLPLIAAYRAVFSDEYRTFRESIRSTSGAVDAAFGAAALQALQNTAEKNVAAVEFWSRYCTFDAGAVAFPGDVLPAAEMLAKATQALLLSKINAPLEAFAVDEPFTVALHRFDEAMAVLRSVNDAIRQVNVLIAEKKAATGAADIATARTELAMSKAAKVRHSEPVATLCRDHQTIVSDKQGIDGRREAVRKALNTHTQSVVKPYEERINAYLDDFNAGFSIAATSHSYPGGVATSTYQLVINQTNVDLGDGRTPGDQPSFKNTLSAGDRTTLALAFYLAHLERDPAIADKIVVFDDPFNSQDAFRRRQTVYEIIKIAAKCKQVIVLSHDATFLKQVWDKAPVGQRVALGIVDQRSSGSKITEIDLERATTGRTFSDLDDLQAFLATGAGQLLDIIRKMRVVLETHCRTSYPASFGPNDWLGDIVGKIRDGGDPHPAAALYEELDQINDYTKQYHHGEDMADATPDQIDPGELTGFTRRTLRMVNALQA